MAKAAENAAFSSSGSSASARPVILVSGVRNKTEEHSDTKVLTDKIRTALLHSGAVQFVADEIREEVIEELQYQTDSGHVDPETRKTVGKQVGADFLLSGDIASIAKEKDDTKDICYKVTLNLVEIETGLVRWAGEKEVRRKETKAWIGW